MFTFYLQLLDLIHLKFVGAFMVFFVFSWLTYIVKLIKAKRFKPLILPNKLKSVSVLIPVVDEPEVIWRNVLSYLKESLKGLDHELFVLANGSNAKKETEIANEMGIKVLHIPVASKRLALEEGAKHCTKEITVILDSDTIVEKNAIKTLVKVFNHNEVGGATPRHEVFNRNDNVMRRISDWMEEIRFNEVLKGQHQFVSCLPGRLLAVRTRLFRELIDDLVGETFLKSPCISGDDRFITSWLLERGWKTVYVPEAEVYTNAPDSLKGFLKQRLRWSRTSLRGTIKSLPWLWRYPFTAFTVLSNVILRWFFFTVIVLAILSVLGIVERQHYINLDAWLVIACTCVGFWCSGLLRQTRHLINYPEDAFYLPLFLIVTTFFLTPTEWYGNLTLKESGWMTRKLD